MFKHRFDQALMPDAEATVEDEKLPLDAALEKLSLDDDARLPSYVLNVPVVVSSDSDATSDEENDVKFKFPEDSFNNPRDFIRLLPSEETVANKKKKNHRRGMIGPEKLLPDGGPVIWDSGAEKVLSTLSFTAFSRDDSRDAYKRLKVVFGLNKMRSLSSARNGALQKSVNSFKYTGVTSRKFGFFWDGIWQKKSNGGWQEITYEEARAFYKQLKHQNRLVAKKFRAEIEKSRGHMVPYREIRDAIKNHQHTSDLVRGSRSDNNPLVYLVFFDGDVVSANSAFSEYDKIVSCAEKSPPAVISGGYLVVEKENPLMDLGVEIDLVVRHATAQYIKAGVYYPEPNTLVIVGLDKDTVLENFSDGTLDYETPKEMPLLMKKVQVARHINAQEGFCFTRQAAIITTCPNRMMREFTARKNHQGKIISWKLADFKTMRGINQSHFKPRSWAMNILQAIQIPSRVTVNFGSGPVILTDKKIISDMLISLISRVFKAYDPIFIAKRAHQRNFASSFRAELIKVMRNYEGMQKELIPAKRKPKKPSKSKKSVSPAVKLKRENADKIWGYLDNITNLNECISLINSFLYVSEENLMLAKGVFVAAEQSHLAVVNVLRQRLSTDFVEMFLSSLIDIHNRSAEDESKVYLVEPSSVQLDEVYSKLLHCETLEKESLLVLFRRMKQRTPSLLGMLPLHFAAIQGDVVLVKWLLEKRQVSTVGWIGDLSLSSSLNILPVHCAIHYCAEHSENHELIKLLTNEHAINAEIVYDGDYMTPFIMVAKYLKNPLPLLEYFVKTYGSKISFQSEFFDCDNLFVEAIVGEYVSLADFLAEYVSDAHTILYDAILDMTPDADKNLIEYGQGYGVDLDDIKNELGDMGLILFNNNLSSEMGWSSEESAEEILEDNDETQYDSRSYSN